jgi:uncharacterized protein YbjQ (UPF0145 family)
VLVPVIETCSGNIRMPQPFLHLGNVGLVVEGVGGGRSGAYEKELKKARNLAFEKIEQAARELGVNAVVGVDVDCEVLGEKNGMLMVSASGTAVIIE